MGIENLGDEFTGSRLGIPKKYVLGADLRLFPLPASRAAVSGITEPGAPSSLFVAAHSDASPPMVATLGLGVIMDAPSRTQNDTSLQNSGAPRSRQIASRRCGIAIISSPLRSRAVGPKSRVGADSRRPSVACAEPRGDLSPARSHAPVPAGFSARRSPLCDVSTRDPEAEHGPAISTG